MSSVGVVETEITERKISAIAKLIGLIALFTLLTWSLPAEEYSGIDAATDTGLKRLENRLYYVLTTLSSVGYGDIYPVSSQARAIGCIMMVLMLFSVV